MSITALALAGGTTWWLAPTHAMASDVWRDLRDRLRHLPGAGSSEVERRIDLHGGGSISVRSAHQPDLLRGAGLDHVVLDEAAFMEPGVWPQVVRPMLLDRNGSAMFLSTPFGRNWFYDLYRLGVDPDMPEWSAWQFTSADNPRISAAELAVIRRTTPERVYREEYLAEFLDDAGQVFRGITQAATAPTDARPVAGRRYAAGVDWGRDHDYTAIAIIDAETGHMVALDRFRGVGWSLQRGRLAALCARWQPSVIWAEANSIGAPNIEALQAEGLPVRPFHTTARSKPALIEALALAIEQGEIGLLPDPVLLHELAAYGLERQPGGGYRYGAPSGSHDDTVIAVALAWYGVRQGGTRVDFA
ncbi:MAG: terminase large subunit domain-containing protein [Chloroflexota bacterium]